MYKGNSFSQNVNTVQPSLSVQNELHQAWFQIQRNPKDTLKKFQQVFSDREFRSPSWEQPGSSTVTNHRAG